MYQSVLSKDNCESAAGVTGTGADVVARVTILLKGVGTDTKASTSSNIASFFSSSSS